MLRSKKYTLYHGITPAMLLELDADTGYLLSYNIINKEHSPYMCENKKAFNNWWERRAVPKNQNNSRVLISGNTNMVYMMNNLSLSLIDNYWIKPVDNAEDYTWESVNLYENDFAEVDFSYVDLENISPFKPSATTQGELQKRWIIKDGKRYLVKGNYGSMYRQSINEVFATLVHEGQGKDAVEYKLIHLPTTMGEGIGCISENFTNIDYEFIPAYDVTFISDKDNGKSVYQKYIDACAAYGIDRDTMQEAMDYMVLSDFLFTNTDRHLLNLGVLRDVKTLRFVKPAPLFDTGNSMFYNGIYNKDTIANIPLTSFYKTEEKMLDQVFNRKALNLELLPSVSKIRALYSEDPYSVVYLDNMLEGYEKKIEMLDAFQRGLSINPRSGKYYAKVVVEDTKHGNVDELQTAGDILDKIET